ncbi:MAG: hypothetical protein E5Y02_00945 [Mesorhizobium sp.]|nr:MAG: hypothetical protein E5Y02_00945 [Mesorhizobium sp.]
MSDVNQSDLAEGVDPTKSPLAVLEAEATDCRPPSMSIPRRPPSLRPDQTDRGGKTQIEGLGTTLADCEGTAERTRVLSQQR